MTHNLTKDRPRYMTPEDFDKALESIGVKKMSKSTMGARLHIVERVSQRQAAVTVGVTRGAVIQTSKKIRRAYRVLCRAPYKKPGGPKLKNSLKQ